MSRFENLLSLLAIAIGAAACNPNFDTGSTARETPADWKGPASDNANSAIEDAITRLKAKTDADLKDVESRKQLGALYGETGNWDEAAAILEEAEANAPEDAGVHV